jgi:hypothetical protein
MISLSIADGVAEVLDAPHKLNSLARTGLWT